MASQAVTISRNYQKKYTKVTKISRKKADKHPTADCCVHKYHKK